MVPTHILSNTALAMCPLLVNLVIPMIPMQIPLASSLHHGANNPLNAGIKYTPPESFTVSANASISAAVWMISRLSLSH
jgi:hypothetical protein